jgi:hypothetical protein
MAKLFQNIAIPNSGSGGISKIYSDSTVNSNNSTFIAIRSQVTNTIGVPDAPQNLIDIRRIGPIYDISSSVPAKQTITFSKNLLRTSSTYSRKRSTLLYDQFPLTNGLLTNKNTPTNNTLIEIKPYGEGVEDRSRMLQNSQALPLVSGPRDVTRMKKYLLSNEGLGFLAFQQRLQAGNTFGQSRGYNPLSIPTAVSSYADASFNNPLVRVSRIISNDTLVNSELWGRLQKETVISTQDRLRVKFVGGAQRRDSALGTIIGTAVNRLINNVLNKTTIKVPGVAQRATNWINRRLGTNFSLGNTVNLGQLSRGIQTVAATGNAILRGLNASNSTLVKDQTAYDALYAADLWPVMKENDGNIRSHQGEKAAYLDRATLAISKAKLQINNTNKSTVAYGVDPTNDYRSSADYTDAVRSGTGTKTFNGVTTATYIKDNFNLNAGRAITDASFLDGVNDGQDYIKFKISVPGVFDSGINFRAFIEDINHSAKGQYEDVRYVGRPERFVTYKGMNRTLTFSMYLIAFSEAELDTIWTRANMLNKLVYPIDNAGGFMVPPLVKITIGNVIVNQPGYVENIDMRFQEIPWDIDKELPQAIKLNMTYNIIEKEYIKQIDTNPILTQQLFGTDIIVNTAVPDARIGTQEFLDKQKSFLQGSNRQLAGLARQFAPKIGINTVSRNPVTIPRIQRADTPSGPTIGERISAGEALDEGGNPIINP